MKKSPALKVRQPDVQLTVRLPKDLHAKVVAHARRNDLTIAQVVRSALRGHLAS